MNVSGSICPKGWHLPSGGSTSATSGGVGTDSEFYKLANGLNISTITASPYLFPAAGGISSSDGSLSGAGSLGHYWSRTSYSSDLAYRLDFNSNNFFPGAFNNYRFVGASVRCVADY